MKGLPLCEHQEPWQPTEAPRSIWISNMVGVLGGSAISLAVAGIRRSAVAIHTSILFNRPIWSLLFFFAATAVKEKKKWLLTTSKAVLMLKRPSTPHPSLSCCSSKDGGYADCQLGVPTSAISTQRKTDVSKGNPEESAVLWRGHKMFYAAGLQRGDAAAFAETFWRTNCYFKGS